jgi:hypothetical protein
VAAEEVEDDDPEIDLGDIKVKKSELKAGYMKDGDYRRKTAEAAEVKRAAEAERMQVRQEREYHANQLEVLIHGLQTQLVGDQQALAQLAESDPAEWVRENAAFQQRYAKLQQAITERTQLANRMTAEQEREQAEWRKAEREALREKLPEWNDPQKAQAEQKMVAEYLISQGYAADDLANLFDHRALVVAREAALWRQHQAAQKTLKDKQVKPEPQKGLKPGAAQQKTQDQQASKVDELRKRAQRTGNQDDIAAYLIAKSG